MCLSEVQLGDFEPGVQWGGFLLHPRLEDIFFFLHAHD